MRHRQPNKACVAASAQPSISANKGSIRVGLRQRQEHPAAFLAALKDAGVSEDLHVARHAWLALAEHLGKLADRQLHQPQQRDDAQPGRIGKRLEIDRREVEPQLMR